MVNFVFQHKNYKMRILIIKLFFALVILIPSCLIGQNPRNSKKLINLGQLEIATVSVSSVNGSRNSTDQYYGASKLFDDDDNIIDGINYNYWLTDAGEGEHWVNVVFSKPVSIHKLIVLLPGKINSTINENLEDPNLDWVNKDAPKDWPTAYSIEVTRSQNDVPESKTYGPIKIKGNKNTHKFKEPLAHIKTIKFNFYSDNMIKVQEIQIMGLVEKGKVNSAEKPEIKTDVEEISKIGRTYMYGEVFDAIISGKTNPKITKTKKGWDYEIIMDDEILVKLKLDNEGNIVSRSYKIIKKSK